MQSCFVDSFQMKHSSMVSTSWPRPGERVGTQRHEAGLLDGQSTLGFLFHFVSTARSISQFLLFVSIPSLRALIKDSSPYSQKLCLKVQGCQQRCVITQRQHNPRKIPISTLNTRGVKGREDKFPRSGPFHCKSTLISFRLHLTCAYEACGNKN